MSSPFSYEPNDLHITSATIRHTLRKGKQNKTLEQNALKWYLTDTLKIAKKHTYIYIYREREREILGVKRHTTHQVGALDCCQRERERQYMHTHVSAGLECSCQLGFRTFGAYLRETCAQKNKDPALTQSQVVTTRITATLEIAKYLVHGFWMVTCCH
eukprot:5785102-Amphidinium_carterae.1